VYLITQHLPDPVDAGLKEFYCTNISDEPVATIYSTEVI
jgi:hypothetical protein